MQAYSCRLIFLAAMFALLLSGNAFANAIFETLNGEVRFVQGNSSPIAATQGRRVTSGATITTGSNGRTLLRFDDGQAVLLNPDSEFRIVDYRFDRNRPQDDSVLFELFKGAMRSVSGLIGTRSSRAFALRIPQATIGIRGTDFMVALVNPGYLSVTNGLVSAVNAGGTATFAAGSTASISTAFSLATGIPFAALPTSVATSFTSLGSAVISAGGVVGTGAGAGGGAGAGVATGAASGGVSLGTMALGAAAAAGLAGVVGSEPAGGASGSSGSTGSTGTR